MANWKSEVERTLEAGMRYCFKAEGGKYPELDEEAFRPIDEPGFLDLVASMIQGMRRECFFQGYACGAVDSIADMGKGEFDFDSSLSRFGAEKAWLKVVAKEEEK